MLKRTTAIDPTRDGNHGSRDMTKVNRGMFFSSGNFGTFMSSSLRLGVLCRLSGIGKPENVGGQDTRLAGTRSAVGSFVTTVRIRHNRK